MTAVRLARGATGRAKIVKFAGLLPRPPRRAARRGRQRRRDARAARVGRRDARSHRRHDRRSVQRPRRARRGARRRTAPTSPRCSSSRSPRTWASSHPSPATSRVCASVATRRGALLVFDEVITGFRLGLGGRAGALRRPARPLDLRQGRRRRSSARRGRRPGRADGRARAARRGVPGRARCRGTRSRPPPGSRCSRSSTRRAYDELETKAATARRRRCATRARAGGVGAQVTRVATLVGLFFATATVADYEGARAADHERYARFFHGLLDRGVFFAPSGYETLFVSPRARRRRRDADAHRRRPLERRRCAKR